MSMNKIIFQIGLLAFCVSAVMFATERTHLLEAVSRSFIVFVGVVVLTAVSLSVVAMVTKKRNDTPAQPQTGDRPRDTAPQQGNDHERKRTA